MTIGSMSAWTMATGTVAAGPMVAGTVATKGQVAWIDIGLATHEIARLTLLCDVNHLL